MKDMIAVLGAVAFIGAAILLQVSLIWGFTAAVLWTAVLFYGGSRLAVGEGLDHAKDAVLRYVQLYAVILLIGASVSSWLASGVVQTLTFYGIQMMEPNTLLVMTFLLTAVSGYFMGTAVGTISTLGIAILGVGRAFGMPISMLIGAAVSGAFIADKLSPLSGLLNLTLVTTGSSYRRLAKAMLPTIAPVFLLSALLYGGLGYIVDPMETAVAQADLPSLMAQYYRLHPAILLLPIAVVVLALMGRPTLQILLAGVVGGGLVAWLLQGLQPVYILRSILTGYQDQSGVLELESLFRSGGVLSMVEVVLIVAGAIVLAALLEHSGVTVRLLKRFIHAGETAGSLLMKTGVVSMILTILTCDQTVGIVMPVQAVEPYAEKKGISREILGRTVSDTGTIIAPLMPWNVNGLIILSVTGVSAMEYAPFAFLCWLMPLTLIPVARAASRGKGMKRSFERDF